MVVHDEVDDAGGLRPGKVHGSHDGRLPRREGRHTCSAVNGRGAGGYLPTMNEEAPTTPTSLADVVALLRQHHQAITSSLADVLDEAGSGREASFARVKRLLSVHEALEQVVVHPSSAQAAEAAGRARLDEEVELSKAITYLEAIGPRSDEFEGAFGRLQRALRAHLSREESDEFPLLAGHLTREQSAQVGVAMSLLSAPDGGSLVDGDTFSEMFDRAVEQITAAVALDIS